MAPSPIWMRAQDGGRAPWPDGRARPHPFPARQSLLSRAAGSRNAWPSIRRASSSPVAAARPSSKPRPWAGLAMPSTCAAGCSPRAGPFVAASSSAAGTASAASRSRACRWRHSPGSAPPISKARCRRRWSAVEAASRVGHQRAEMVARHMRLLLPCRARRARGSAARAPSARSRSRASSAPAGSRPRGWPCWARSRLPCGRRAAALDLLREALAISRETGMAYWGAIVLGWLALLYATMPTSAGRRSPRARRC